MKDVLAAPVNKKMAHVGQQNRRIHISFMTINKPRKKNYLHFGQKCVDVGGGRVKDVRRKVVPHFQTSKNNFFLNNKNLHFILLILYSDKDSLTRNSQV